MSFPLAYFPEALKDLDEAAAWYDAQSAGLGRKFLEKIKEGEKYISKYPHTRGIRYSDKRVHRIKTFPYSIHFFLDEGADVIYVVGVFHDKRNPNIWYERD